MLTKRKAGLVGLLILPLLIIASPGYGLFSFKKKVKVVQKPDSHFDFKAVQDIAVLPITSKNVDFGKVDPKRMPKIKALLEKMKVIIRKQIVEGSKLSKATKNFHYQIPNRKETTLLLTLNFDQFDNGMQAMRAVPKGVPMKGFIRKKGQAKVTLRAQLLHPKTKAVLTEFTAQAVGDGGLVTPTGGFDAEVLYSASGEANGFLYKHFSKLIGNKYKLFVNIREKAKMGVKDQQETLKEEKREIPPKKQ